MSVKENIVEVKGFLDVYKNSSYDKGISEGDAKLSTTYIHSNWKIFNGDLTEDDILLKLRNRLFRETHYENDGLILKELLKLKRSGKDYNFQGGSHAERSH